jgi:L-lactate dehydrogenase complex protein LldG
VNARADVLERIRSALGPSVAVPEIPREYRGPGAADGGDVVARFCARAAEYKATVRRLTAADLPGAVRELCRGRRIAVPSPPSFVGRSLARGPDVLSGVEVVVDDPPLSAQALDQLDGVLTGCALAIAETGTIVLDGGQRSGRRALTLVPDWHICIVEADAIVAGVPDAVATLAEAAADGRPITLVSGPSATSDIELDRVEGVHGPRTLDVLVAS